MTGSQPSSSCASSPAKIIAARHAAYRGEGDTLPYVRQRPDQSLHRHSMGRPASKATPEQSVQNSLARLVEAHSHSLESAEPVSQLISNPALTAPTRSDRCRKMGVEESTKCDPNVAGADVCDPVNRASASWAKVLRQLTAVLTVSDKHG